MTRFDIANRGPLHTELRIENGDPRPGRPERMHDRYLKPKHKSERAKHAFAAGPVKPSADLSGYVFGYRRRARKVASHHHFRAFAEGLVAQRRDLSEEAGAVMGGGSDARDGRAV